jgi:hypothetical protein
MFSTPITFLKFAVPSGPVYDPDAEAFFARVTAAGGSLTLTERNATNQLVLDLKSYSIWSAMKVIYPMVGSSAASCAQNLASSSFTGTFSGGWTFANTGAKPNGTNAYMDTGFAPASHLIDSSSHLSHYSRTQNIEISAYDMNSYNPTGNTKEFGLSQYYGGISSKIFMAYYYPDQGVLPNVPNTLGFQIGTRVSNSLSKIMFNGGIIGTNTNDITGTGHTLPTVNTFVGGSNADGFYYQFSDRENAFCSIGDGLTNQNLTDFTTAIQTFQTTLGRQVGYDPSAQAFLNATGITDPTISSAINNLVIDLKTASLWNKFYAIWPIVGGTATTTKYNLVDPQDTDAAFRMTWNGGWTFGASGAQGNATNTYGDTHFIMNTDLDDVQNVSTGHYTLDTYAQVQAYVNFGLATRSSFTGAWSYFNDLGVNANFGLFDPYKEDYRVGTFSPAVNSQGLNIAESESATNHRIYRNATLSASGSANSSAGPIPTYSLFLGARNEEEYNGYPSYVYPTGNTWAFAYISDSIGSSNISTFYTIVQDFQTALGRQV